MKRSRESRRRERKRGDVVESELKKRLMRLLHGEVSQQESEALQRRLSEDREAGAFYGELTALWEGLAAPPERPVPADFSATVLGELRRQGMDSDLSWGRAPVWVRALTAAAALIGILVGAGVATFTLDSGSAFEDSWAGAGGPATLVETYFEALASDEPLPGQFGENS